MFPRAPHLVALTALGLILSPGTAHAEDDGPAGPAVEGFRSTLDPGIMFVLSPVGSTAFTLSDHIGYGIRVGDFVVSPGVSVPIYTFSNNFTIAVMGEVKAMMPIGMWAPYVRAGGGVAIFTGVGSTDVAVRAGGGAMFFPLKQFGVGADFVFQKLGNVDGLQLSIPIQLLF